MEIITEYPIISIIVAVLSVIGIGFAIKIRIRRGSNYVNQKDNTTGGHMSGRDTNVNNGNGKGK